jgi:hypothetical protein
MMRRETGIERLASSSATPMRGLPDLQLHTNHCAAANGRDVPIADISLARCSINSSVTVESTRRRHLNAEPRHYVDVRQRKTAMLLPDYCFSSLAKATRGLEMKETRQMVTSRVSPLLGLAKHRR